MRAFIDFRMRGSDFAPRIAAVQMRFGDAPIGQHGPQGFAQAGGNRSFFCAAAPAHGGAGNMRAFYGDFE